jgi:hypothetical protein
MYWYRDTLSPIMANRRFRIVPLVREWFWFAVYFNTDWQVDKIVVHHTDEDQHQNQGLRTKAKRHHGCKVCCFLLHAPFNLIKVDCAHPRSFYRADA